MIMFVSIFYFQPQILAEPTMMSQQVKNDADMRTLGWCFFHGFGAATWMTRV